MAIDSKKLAHEMMNFINGLRKQGYPDDISLICVIGDSATKEISCVPIICQGFEHPTIATLDTLVSQVKVNGMPHKSKANVVITNGDNESTFLNEMDDVEMEKAMLGEMKDIYLQMIAELGEKKGRLDFLRNMVYSLAKNLKEWNTIPLEKKMDMVNEILTTTKEKSQIVGDWFPHYDNHEIISILDEINHLAQFGYQKSDTTDDVAFR